MKGNLLYIRFLEKVIIKYINNFYNNFLVFKQKLINDLNGEKITK